MNHFFTAFFVFLSFTAFAQGKLLSGTVTDKQTGKPLPFATLSLKKGMSGSLSNEQGGFDLLIPAGSETDTLVISFLGYNTKKLAVAALASPLTVALEKNSITLQEAVIRSLTPEQYIVMAIRSIKDNYPDKPFQTLGYYSERAKENKNYLKDEEAVFKTYYPNYTDSTENTHQLLLYRKGETKPLTIFKDKVDKALEKEKKEAKKNGEEYEEVDPDQLITSFGGPEAILSSDFISEREYFLDTTLLRKYKFSFGPSSGFLGKELITINFQSRKVIEYQWQTGKIFMDPYTFAIVSVDYTAFIELPVIAQPALFALGIGLEEIAYEKKYNYYELNGKWYPQNFRVEGTARLIRKHVFKANEVSDFKLEQLFMVSETITEGATPVDKSKKYQYDKKFEGQVFNESNVSWGDINVIRR